MNIIPTLRRFYQGICRNRDDGAKRYRTLIEASGLFDAEWYLDMNADVQRAGVNPLSHYIRHGDAEGRDPNPFFNVKWYQEQNPDVKRACVNSLYHYAAFGESEGRRPNPNFCPTEYAVVAGPAQGGPGSLLREYLFSQHRVTTIDRLNAIAQRSNKLILGAGERVYTLPQYRPLVSIVLPTFNTPPVFLRECIDSIVGQAYSNWELCIVDDGSKSESCLALLRDYEGSDPRIKITYSSHNHGIAEASQVGLDKASGEFIAFVDHDDIITRAALFDAVAFLGENPLVDYLYTDHAMIDSRGQYLHGAFKPGWSPELLLSTNYIVHFKIVRASLLRKIGGFRAESHIIQDLDITLRLMEAGATIAHQPLIAYFWRQHPQSVASGTSAKPSIERLAVELYDSHLRRTGSNVSVEWPSRFRAVRTGAYKLKFPDPNPFEIAIIVLAEMSDEIDVKNLNVLSTLGYSVNVIFSSREDVPQLRSEISCFYANNDTDFTAILSSLEHKYLVFIRPTASILTKTWVDELVGYLELNPNIGLVGGKVLDVNLNIMASGIVLSDDLQPTMVVGSDNSDGFWLNMQVASNVGAVSSGLMAVRKSDIIRCGVLPISRYGIAFGVFLSLKLREMGMRVVLNPWSKVLDRGEIKFPKNLPQLLRTDFGDKALSDPYHHPLSRFLEQR